MRVTLGGNCLDPSLSQKIYHIILYFNQFDVVWKMKNNQDSGQLHLSKRKRRNEIPGDWTLTDYNSLILNIMNGEENHIHLYPLTYFTKRYFTFDDGNWIVIVGEDGVMETCMKGNPENYFLNNPGYTYLGTIKDVLK